LTSLVIKEVIKEINTTMRRHSAPTNRAAIRSQIISSVAEGLETQQAALWDVGGCGMCV
jgi:hypothetical protein